MYLQVLTVNVTRKYESTDCTFCQGSSQSHAVFCELASIETIVFWEVGFLLGGSILCEKQRKSNRHQDLPCRMERSGLESPEPLLRNQVVSFWYGSQLEQTQFGHRKYDHAIHNTAMALFMAWIGETVVARRLFCPPVGLGFTVLFNLALLSTFVWPEWLGNSFPVVAWPIVGIVWLSHWFISSRMLDETIDPSVAQDKRSDALFISAQTEYLNGNWHEAEALLVRQLRFRPRDIEARLLLATLHRHTGNYDKALQEIEQLLKFDESIRWQLEIERLQQHVEDELEYESSSESETDETDPAISLTINSPDPQTTDEPETTESFSDQQRAA